MCVVTRRTYVHADGRREVVEKPRLCHNAVGDRLCAYVETNQETVRVKERRPSSSRRESSSNIVTTSGGGREQHWKRLSRTTSKRNSSGRESKASTSSPADSAAGSSSSPIHPLYQEYRPSAPEPPLMSGALPSARRSGTLSPTSPTYPPNPFRSATPGVSARYERPPSFERPRAEDAEPPTLSRHPSLSSIAAEVNELPRRPSIKRRATVDPAASASKHQSSRSRGKSHARIDSIGDDTELERRRRLVDEDDRQARLVRDQIEASNQRQNDRLAREHRRRDEEQSQIERDILEEAKRRRRSNQSREAEQAARQRAENLRRERQEASRERHRREAEAALEGQRQTQYEERYQRLHDAELAAIDRERVAADVRQRESAERYQELRGSPSSGRNSYTYGPSSPLSARQYTVVPRPPVALHHYPSTRRNSAMLERGERVIAREQARPRDATRRLEGAMAGMELEDALDGEMAAALERSNSQRWRREARERERERQRRLRQQGYY